MFTTQTKIISLLSQTLQDFFSFNLILEKPWTQSLFQWSLSVLPNSVVGSLLPDQSPTWQQFTESLVQGLVSRTTSKGKKLFILPAKHHSCSERRGLRSCRGSCGPNSWDFPKLQPFLSVLVLHEDLGVLCWNFSF